MVTGGRRDKDDRKQNTLASSQTSSSSPTIHIIRCIVVKTVALKVDGNEKLGESGRGQ